MLEWPFLQLTDGRKRCYKRIKDLISNWKGNTKLVLSRDVKIEFFWISDYRNEKTDFYSIIVFSLHYAAALR